MTVSLNTIPRTEKRDVARRLHDNLADRAAAGPAEPALDEYVPELATVVQALSGPIVGSLLADAQRTARLADLEMADVEVDRYYRHIESFLDVESRCRAGVNVVAALALHKAAFPDGLAHIDAPVPDENRLCHESLIILRSEEYAPTLTAIELPMGWLDKWEVALQRSEAIYGEIEKARTARRAHVSAGLDAEAELVELCVRLRRYIGSRAKSSDKARVAEGRELLAPLLDAMAQLRATAAARAALRENEKKAAKPPAPGDGQPV